MLSVYSTMKNLVFKARSEFSGSALLNEKALNSKHEMRNPKQCIMTKIPMIQTISISAIAILVLFLSLGHLVFEFVSYFDIRISNFPDISCVNHALWA